MLYRNRTGIICMRLDGSSSRLALDTCENYIYNNISFCTYAEVKTMTMVLLDVPYAMCHAALFHRCVLSNAFKELFAAKYLLLHFSRFPSTYNWIYICMAELSQFFLSLYLYAHTPQSPIKYVPFYKFFAPNCTLGNFNYFCYFIVSLLLLVIHILVLCK